MGNGQKFYYKRRNIKKVMLKSNQNVRDHVDSS